MRGTLGELFAKSSPKTLQKTLKRRDWFWEAFCLLFCYMELMGMDTGRIDEILSSYF
jgi:hypothetical protein